MDVIKTGALRRAFDYLGLACRPGAGIAALDHTAALLFIVVLFLLVIS